jgi:hypothetical protein
MRAGTGYGRGRRDTTAALGDTGIADMSISSARISIRCLAYSVTVRWA